MVSAAAFLQRHGWRGAHRTALPGDASARRYERLRLGDRRALLMLAPRDDTAADFMAIAGLLNGVGLSVPEILAADPDQGLLLVEDFGDGTYTALLDGGAEALPLYQLAVDALIHLHRTFGADAHTAPLPDLSVFDAERFLQQSMLFCDSDLPGAMGPLEGAVADSFSQAWKTALSQAMSVPQSLLLRDFHAGNLFHLAGRPSVRACGLIDFQDAGVGPVTYDLVSLLQDARRDIADDVTAACLARYRAAFPDIAPADFATSYAVLAAQRHVRVIAIFSRLARQGKPGYLDHLPRLWRLLDQALQHPALAQVAAWFDVNVPPQVRGNDYGR
jgi:hypothetical protein